MAKRKSTKGMLVKSYAEGIKSQVLERNQEAVKRVVGRKSGIYLLSKAGKPYYIGLSNKLARGSRRILTTSTKESGTVSVSTQLARRSI